MIVMVVKMESLIDKTKVTVIEVIDKNDNGGERDFMTIESVLKFNWRHGLEGGVIVRVFNFNKSDLKKISKEESM